MNVNFQKQSKSPAFSKLHPSRIKTQIFVSFCILFFYLLHMSLTYHLTASRDCLLSFAYYCLSFVSIYPPSWPSIFTRLNITHFEEKNRRPDFLKDHLRKRKVNSGFLSIYKEILMYK